MSDLPPTEKPKWVEDAEKRMRIQDHAKDCNCADHRVLRQISPREPQPAWPPGSPVGEKIALPPHDLRSTVREGGEYEPVPISKEWVGVAIQPMRLPPVAEFLTREILSLRRDADWAKAHWQQHHTAISVDSATEDVYRQREHDRIEECWASYVLEACTNALKRQDEMIAHYQRLEVERVRGEVPFVAFCRGCGEKLVLKRESGDCRCGAPTQFDEILRVWRCLNCKKMVADCECPKAGV